MASGITSQLTRSLDKMKKPYGMTSQGGRHSMARPEGVLLGDKMVTKPAPRMMGLGGELARKVSRDLPGATREMPLSGMLGRSRNVKPML